MTETTVFQSGNSQAVRLPKEFRFKSKTVEIFRRGDEVVLREKKRTMGEVLRSLPPLSEADAAAMADALSDLRDDRPLQERDWDRLFGDDPGPDKP